MLQESETTEFVTKLAAAWPAAEWRDVHVAVAVSGGADSVALLRGLVEVKRQVGGAGLLHAVHVNHGLRGAESDADAVWVRELCERLEAPVIIERCDVTMLAAEQGDGIEAAARTARYRSLTSAAESVGARFVALGQTADDQVETVLFRLLRGTGLRGLAGIPPRRALSLSVSAVRPMLGVRREEIVRYLGSIGQAFREDASNADRRFARNRIRRELLPTLRASVGPEIDAAILELSGMAAEAQAVIEDAASELLARCELRHSDGGQEITLSTQPLGHARDVIACEVLRLAWRQAGFAEQAMTREWWQRLAELARSTAGGLNMPGNVLATRPTADVLSLRRLS